VGLSRWHRQDGLIRGVIEISAVLVVVAILVLDTVSVYNARLGVRQNASDAANQALSTFIQTGNTRVALESASSFLKIHGAYLIGKDSEVTPSANGPEHATVVIAAGRTPHTYVYHYFQDLGWGIGPWFHKLLNPTSKEPSSNMGT